MATINPVILTTGQQALLDSVARDILTEWPHLEEGQFDVLGDTYVLELYRQHAPAADVAQEVTDSLERSLAGPPWIGKRSADDQDWHDS